MQNILLEECIEKLRNKQVYNLNISDKIFNEFSNYLRFTFYGRIDWQTYSNKQKLFDVNDILSFLDKDNVCLLLYNEVSLPVIETIVEDLIICIDDVLAVSFDTWVWIKKKNIIIEFFHDGEITLLDMS